MHLDLLINRLELGADVFLATKFLFKIIQVLFKFSNKLFEFLQLLSLPLFNKIESFLFFFINLINRCFNRLYNNLLVSFFTLITFIIWRIGYPFFYLFKLLFSQRNSNKCKEIAKVCSVNLFHCNIIIFIRISKCDFDIFLE